MADGNAPVRLLVLSPPATRGDCADIPRPCQRTNCRHNLGTRWRFEPAAFRTVHSCSLDVAEGERIATIGDPSRDAAMHAGHHAIGQIVGGFSRERSRQIEVEAKRHFVLKAAMEPDADLILDSIGLTWADVLEVCARETRSLEMHDAARERKSVRERAARLARASGKG